MDREADIARVASLGCWRGVPRIKPLAGGMTNRNWLVRDAAGAHVARLGEDLPHHMVLRWHEHAVARAAGEAGISPEVEHAGPGVLVMRFVEGRSLAADDLRAPGRIEAVAALLRRCHRELPLHLRGPSLAFWPFHAIRGYAAMLREGGSAWLGELDVLLALAAEIEAGLSPAPTVFAHNDLLAANLVDDGQRLWLIDWDYAGWGSPVFDLANLAANNGLDAAQEEELLSAYLGAAPGTAMRRDLAAMRLASQLRETLWSMASELRPSVDFDYAAYTRENLARLEAERARLGVARG
jgi:thiamine kinase-like enzyme